MELQTEPIDPRPTKQSWLPTATWAVILTVACAVFYGNLRFGTAAISIGFADDFYYYAQVARNIAADGYSSFDGFHITNGYHPLWLLVLTVVTKIFDVGGITPTTSVYPMTIAVETLQVALIAVIGLYSGRIARLYSGVASSCAVQLIAVAGSLAIVRTGMEAGLTIALAFVTIWFRVRPGFRWSLLQVFQYSTLCSLLILSRLDTVPLIVMLLLFDVLIHGKGLVERLISIGIFIVGLWMVGADLIINKLVFGLILPISTVVKMQRITHWPSPDATLSFAQRLFDWQVPAMAVCFLLTLAVPVMLWRRQRHSPSGVRGVFWAFLLFPIVHLLTVTMVSDWKIWPWHVYAWPISAALALIVLLPRPGGRRPVKQFGPVAAAVAFALLGFEAGYFVLSSSPANEDGYLAAQDIAAFAKTHPGNYGMGDRAGVVGYLIKQPVVQLGGLYMDFDYLNNIEDEKNVKDAIQSTRVNYYIVTNPTLDKSGCYITMEPAQAGPDSVVMRSLICEKPVAKFTHQGTVNMIFDMQ